ncbi:MAG: S1C family serine protease [Paracoccaceae bacterium]
MFKTIYLTILLSIIILLNFINFSYSNPISAWEKSASSVVSVLPTWPGFKKSGFGAPPGTAPEGTGIVISSSGHVLTASHVVKRAKFIEIRDINGNKFDASLVFNDQNTDLAIIKADINLLPIKISRKVPKIASSACLISNSFGLDLGITCGVVSAIGRKEYWL